MGLQEAAYTVIDKQVDVGNLVLVPRIFGFYADAFLLQPDTYSALFCLLANLTYIG